jgi:hypothetical protein
MSLLFAFFLFGSSSFCLPGRFPRLPFAVMDFHLGLRYERYVFMMGSIPRRATTVNGNLWAGVFGTPVSGCYGWHCPCSFERK